jgi:hypothetical protein
MEGYMDTISKNRMRKMRRFPKYKQEYFDYMISMFLYGGESHKFEDNIGYSILRKDRNLTGEFVEYAKSIDKEAGEKIEMEIHRIIGDMARKNCPMIRRD